MSGHLTSSEKISITKIMKIKKCQKMPLSLASSSDVARILAMTHIDFLDLWVMATTSLILVDFQSNGAEILKVEIYKRELWRYGVREMRGKCSGE